MLSLLETSDFFISNNNTPILQLFRIFTHMKYFSGLYVVCTSNNNDLVDKSRKRNFDEFNEENSLSLQQNIKNKKIEDLSRPFDFIVESEESHENPSKNNTPKQVIIEYKTEKYICNLYFCIINYITKNDLINYDKILSLFEEMIRNYELNKNMINKKEFKLKIETILKILIEKSFLLSKSIIEKYSFLLKEIYESSSKALDIEIECDKIKDLYEYLLDMNFENDISQNKKYNIMKFKDILLKTKDYDIMEENIKKNFYDNSEIFVNTKFFKIFHCFFSQEEYFLLKLFRGSYLYGKNNLYSFLKDKSLKIEDIMKIIESYDENKLFLVFNNVSFNCLNEILKRFTNGKKKFEIFSNYMNSDNFNSIERINSNIDVNFLYSNFEILSAYIYYINFNELCYLDRSANFILKISKMRKEKKNLI